MESPPDPTSDPGNSASESATPVRETPVNLETLRKAEHQAPVRRQSCSSTNRVWSWAAAARVTATDRQAGRQILALWLAMTAPGSSGSTD
ncbi:hypothetical protein AOLI_G00182920 [Acnodon oligacanthus]